MKLDPTKPRVRRAKSKSAKVREMILKGHKVPEIVRATKASPQLVYALRSQIRKEQGGSGIASLPVVEPQTESQEVGIVGLRTIASNWYDTPRPAEITEVVTTRKMTIGERIANAWRKLWK
jgi:hypothetical protein